MMTSITAFLSSSSKYKFWVHQLQQPLAPIHNRNQLNIIIKNLVNLKYLLIVLLLGSFKYIREPNKINRSLQYFNISRHFIIFRTARDVFLQLVMFSTTNGLPIHSPVLKPLASTRTIRHYSNHSPILEPLVDIQTRRL